MVRMQAGCRQDAGPATRHTFRMQAGCRSSHWGGPVDTGFIGAVSQRSERAAPVHGCMGAGLVSFYHDR